MKKYEIPQVEIISLSVEEGLMDELQQEGSDNTSTTVLIEDAEGD